MDNPMLTIVLILAAVCVVLLAAVLVLLRRLGSGGAQQALLREQAALRQAYLQAIKGSLVSQLENTTIVEPDGTRHPVRRHTCG